MRTTLILLVFIVGLALEKLSYSSFEYFIMVLDIKDVISYNTSPTTFPFTLEIPTSITIASSFIMSAVIKLGIPTAVITISAVMMYYGVAKETAQAIGQGEDIAGNYTNYILDLLLYNKKTDGTGVKNILNYFYLNERVSVDITTMTNLGSVKNTLANNVTQTNNVTNVNNNVSLYNSIN